MKKIILGCLFGALAYVVKAQTQIIAHRGFWNTENSAQNSIASLQKAAEVKVYGSEFDVQLTSDGIVVVNHDDRINGLIISEITYSRLQNMNLKNGEKIPTLYEYLTEGKQLKNVQLILEIKPHKTLEQEKEITEKVVKMVAEIGMEKQVEYISFSKYICEILVKLTPQSPIAYLKGDISPKELKEKGINGIDYHFKVFYEKPEWVKEAHELGMKVNAWTVNKTEDMRKMFNLNIDYITTDNPTEALKLKCN